ncbi:MAG: hypothetical protein F4X93_04100 [Proteobacteria bacterium]|nr:hypothetical protein [Pseudomonadota bacterium]
MDSVLQGAAAGLIAAIAIGLFKYIYIQRARYQDIKHIRSLVIEGRKQVMGAKDHLNEEGKVKYSADFLRCAFYNNMLKKLKVALDKTAVTLTHVHRKEIYDALNWYNTDIYMRDSIMIAGDQFYDLPEGKWPSHVMLFEEAKRKFENLQDIKWLKLDPL